MVETFLGAAGKELDVDYTLQTLPPQEQIDAVQDGNASALITWTTLPSPGYESMDQSTSIKILHLEDEIIEKIQTEIDPGGEPVTAPAGLYSGQEEDVTVYMSPRFYATRADVDEEMVYEFTKYMIENAEELTKYHPTAEEITIENTLSQMMIPLHPGAIKYFEEEGYEVPEELK